MFRIYPLVTQTSSRCAKRSCHPTSNLSSYHAIAIKLHTRVFHISLAPHDAYPDNANGKPISRASAPFVDSQKTSNSPSEPSSTQDSKYKMNNEISRYAKHNHTAQSTNEILSKLFGIIDSPQLENALESRTKANPDNLLLRKPPSRERSTSLHSQRFFDLLKTNRVKSKEEWIQSLDSLPVSRFAPKPKYPIPKTSETIAKEFKDKEPRRMRAEYALSRFSYLPEIAPDPELNSHPTLLKYGLTSEGKKPDAASYSRAEIILSLLEDNLWGPLVENFDFHRGLAKGWHPGENPWLSMRRMEALLSGFSRKELSRVGVSKGFMILSRKFAEYLADRVGDRTH